MNIFVLNADPHLAARDHCDKHIVKMILEYGQLLSSAHRLLDGKPILLIKPNNKAQQLLLLPSEVFELNEEKGRYYISNPLMYSMTHANHPSASWARQSVGNYNWLFALFDGCLAEYTKRYGKVHLAARIKPAVEQAPRNIPTGELTPFALAMPEQYRVADAVTSYQNYYVHDKIRFAKWTNTPAPEWFVSRSGLDSSNFERSR